MPLQIGTRLGPYEMLAALGAGGMGEVYKARDTRLDRIVAIKVLSETLSGDLQFRARFDREARAISQLDHRHICALYDVGEHAGTAYLVMQYLEGETLASRLAREVLPLGEALRVAIEIGSALDTAHRAGIVHRDLKPGNIMLTKSGARLLDFGLAKGQAPVATGAALANLPTTPADLTEQGMILGTLQYMAPEQLDGQETDTRADIFAFGAVIYEAVTGRKAFEGQSRMNLIGAILKDTPPPISFLQRTAPQALDRVIARCLAKDPDDRWQTVRDLCQALEWVAADGALVPVPGRVGGRRWTLSAFWAIPAGAALVLVAAMAAWTLKPVAAPEAPVVARFVVPLPPGVETSSPGGRIAVSPDGTKLAFSGITKDGSVGIYVRSLESLETKLLITTNGIAVPFFSADSRWLAFSDAGKLKKVAVSGGAALPLCDYDGNNSASGTWVAGDLIYFVSAREVWKVSASGGTPLRVTVLDRAKGEANHNFPQVVADGKVLLMTVTSGLGWDESQIEAQSLESGERRVVVRGGKKGTYLPSGHLVYHRSANEELMAVPLDLKTLTVTGEAVHLGEHVRSQGLNPEYALSESGSLAYVLGDARGVERRLAWIDRDSRVKTFVEAPPRPYMEARLSPDGRYAAISILGGTVGLWLYDFTRPGLEPLTSGNSSSYVPIWTRDSKRVAYTGIRNGNVGLYAKSIDGTDREEELLAGEEGRVVFPGAWTVDGTRVLVQIVDAEGSDIWVLSVADRKLQRLIEAPSWECCFSLSPDGRWLAYTSNSTGKFEVHLQAFPNPGKRIQISKDGGEDPRWSPEGRALYYFNRAKVMAVDLGAGPDPIPKPPQLFFESGFPQANTGEWDIAANGKRFLFLERTDAERPATEIHVVMNWAEELKRRMK